MCDGVRKNRRQPKERGRHNYRPSGTSPADETWPRTVSYDHATFGWPHSNGAPPDPCWHHSRRAILQRRALGDQTTEHRGSGPGRAPQRSAIIKSRSEDTVKKSSPRRALCFRASIERARRSDSSSSLIVPFMPSNNRSFGWRGSYVPSSSTITVPTRPQNSINVCQSRPLRARRDASMATRHRHGPHRSPPAAARSLDG